MKDNKVIVDTVIDLLIDIDCDGETMEFILRKVGMEYQMLRQLMMTMPLEQVEYLLEERKDNEELDKPGMFINDEEWEKEMSR